MQIASESGFILVRKSDGFTFNGGCWCDPKECVPKIYTSKGTIKAAISTNFGIVSSHKGPRSLVDLAYEIDPKIIRKEDCFLYFHKRKEFAKVHGSKLLKELQLKVFNEFFEVAEAKCSFEVKSTSGL